MNFTFKLLFCPHLLPSLAYTAHKSLLSQISSSKALYSVSLARTRGKLRLRNFMVSVNPSPAHCYTSSLDLMNMSLPGFNSIPHKAAPVTEGFGVSTIATMPVNVRNNTMSFFEDPTKKIRKPYTIKKSRENWTEQEHDKFLEALHLFDRDWKKIEAFIGSKTVIQIRSHAQKYFLKVQKSGTNEHLPPPRPKRKASHPYPQKAPKSVAFTSHVIGSVPSQNVLFEPEYLYTTDSQSLAANPAVSTPTSPSWRHGFARHPVNIQKSVIKEESGTSAPALPENCCSTSSTRDKQRTRTVTEPNDQERCEKPQRVMPNFAEVYSFIGSVFDPDTTGHVKRLKQMDPINLETVILLMRNLSVNLTTPEFEEQRRLISTYNSK